MAKLHKYWAKFPQAGIDYPKGDWDKGNKLEKKALQQYMDESNALKGTNIQGAVIRFGRGDGYAYYRVRSEKPLTLEHIPFSDRYQVESALIRGLTKKDILKQLKIEKEMVKWFGEGAW